MASKLNKLEVGEKDSSAVALINDAIANVRANVGEKGLTPQQARAVQKLETASRLLTGRQTKQKEKE